MADEENGGIHPDLKSVADSLEGGDIQHHCAMVALDTMFENWTALASDPEFSADPESLAEDCLNQFDRLIDVLKAIRPQVVAAVSSAVVPAAAPQSK